MNSVLKRILGFFLVGSLISNPIALGEDIAPSAVPIATPSEAGATKMQPPSGALMPTGQPASPQPNSSTPPPVGTPSVPSGATTQTDPSAPIKRPIAPPEAPNKRELDVRPDEQGMVQFQFRNQPWPDVLKWLAETSGMSLDWQELPNDYINLSTQRPYTIVQTRDLVNRHLLARGFTLLEIDGMLQVGKTDKINSALVPKVLPEELDALPAHRFVRCCFTLDTLLVEEVVEEFKSLLSSNGKLIPLHSTNRLEAMDAAGNLQEIKNVLIDEQSETARQQLAREFPLQFVRADEVKLQLEVFLGISKRASPTITDPGQMAAMQQQMMQQQQMMAQQMQAGAKPDGSAGNQKKRPSDVYLVSNPRQNSVIVHAPPDKMAIVAAFVKRVDVPNPDSKSFHRFEQRLKVYRLASISPKQLVASLIAMDALEPTTRLEVDEDNNAIIAHASLADQYAIQQVIDRLDGSARSFDVLQLRRLKAEEVAGTIKFLMGVKETKDENKNSRRSFYFDPFNQGADEKKKKDDSFRVGANVEDNQILLWANEIEREEINNLLVKLGEIPANGNQGNPFRIIEGSRSAEMKEYLEAIKKKWNNLSPGTSLILPADSEFELSPGDSTKSSKVEDSPDATGVNDESNSDGTDGNNKTLPVDPNANPNPGNVPEKSPTALSRRFKEQFVDTPSVNQASSPFIKETAHQDPLIQIEKAPEKTPIAIEFDADGNLILKSPDINALNQLEALMLRDTPPKKPYDVFEVKNTRASWIELNLVDYFKDDKKKDDPRESFFRFLWLDETPQKKNEEPQLGKKRVLRFISDNDTNTIIAIGASNSEKRLIKELIALWDTPDTKKAKDARYTKLVSVKYSRAEAIEQAIKDAYRDFLSDNDKAFDRDAPPGSKGSEEKRDRGSSGRKFSLGVDKLTNTIIVSAEGEDFLKVICDMITQLDLAAQPSGVVKVLEFSGGGTSSKSMEKALKALLESAKNKNPNANNPNQINQSQPNQNGGQPVQGQGGDGN